MTPKTLKYSEKRQFFRILLIFSGSFPYDFDIFDFKSMYEYINKLTLKPTDHIILIVKIDYKSVYTMTTKPQI